MNFSNHNLWHYAFNRIIEIYEHKYEMCINFSELPEG